MVGMTKAVFLLVSLALLSIAFLAGGVSTSGTSRAAERMVQEDDSGLSTDGSKSGLDDYQPVDPSPSSKAVRPGPIEHGTPLIPYIPQPAPPNPPTYSTYP